MVKPLRFVSTDHTDTPYYFVVNVDTGECRLMYATLVPLMLAQLADDAAMLTFMVEDIVLGTRHDGEGIAFMERAILNALHMRCKNRKWRCV